MRRDQIMTQALRCIDEIYPEDNQANGPNFPLADFLDEAARRVLLAAPLHAIPTRKSLVGCALRPASDGSGEIDLPADFLRLAHLRMEGWQRPILAALPEDHPDAFRQYHPVMRGGAVKPVVLLTDGGTKLRYFSIPHGVHRIAEGAYIPFDRVDDNFPARLFDTTAWMLAALVLGISHEPSQAQAAEGRATQMLSLL